MDDMTSEIKNNNVFGDKGGPSVTPYLTNRCEVHLGIQFVGVRMCLLDETNIYMRLHRKLHSNITLNVTLMSVVASQKTNMTRISVVITL
jgi:hypothetical protein